MAVIASAFSGNYDGIKWSGCTLDVSTYKAASGLVQLNVQLSLTELASGRIAKAPLLLTFIREGNSWRLDGFKIQQ